MVKSTTFSKDLLMRACKLFYRVYVDKVEGAYFVPNQESTVGVRVRLYSTSWDYETPIIVYNNNDLQKVVKEYEMSIMPFFQ